MFTSVPQTSGIYKITCIANGRIYIGSTVDIRNRWQEHLRDLRHETHHSCHLQRAWAKYGEEAFSFEIIELVLSPFLTEREQYWLDRLNPYGKRGFNNSRQASTTLGVLHTDETRRKMSAAHAGKPKSRQHVENQAEAVRQEYVFVSPSKEIIYVKGMAQFCRSVGLPTSPIGRLLTRSKKYRSYKGWMCFRSNDPDLDTKIAQALVYVPPSTEKK